MKPGIFCVENALEILSDDYRRILTAEARQFAEEGRPARTDFGKADTYWCAVVNEHKRLLWLEAYEKRKARLARMRSMDDEVVRGNSTKAERPRAGSNPAVVRPIDSRCHKGDK